MIVMVIKPTVVLMIIIIDMAKMVIEIGCAYHENNC